MARLDEYTLVRADRRSWLARAMQSLRSITLGPWNPRDPAIAKYFGGRSVSAGVSVNNETALMVSVVFAAISTIAQDVASLPLCLFRRLPGGGKKRLDTHPLGKLLHSSPNPEQTSYAFRQTLMMNALLGNGYAEIERDAAGRPVALWPIASHRVTVVRENGGLRYRVANDTKPAVTLEAADMIHVRGLSPDGDVGLDVVRIAREALGLAIASERYAATFFGNGATVGGVLSVGGGLSPEALKNLREAFETRHQGVDRAHRVLLAPPDSKFETINVTPHDSQLAELREHQLREVCRFFKIPTAMIGDLGRATWGNFSEQRLSYFTQCIQPWLVNIESELEHKLVPALERNQQLVEFVTEGFLRGNPTERAAFYASALSNGWMTIAEVRERENLAPLPDAAAAADDVDVEEKDSRTASMLAALRAMCEEVMGRMVRRESEKARRNQATPQKLRAWAETYYGDHEDTCVEALRPVIRLYLAWAQSSEDPDAVTLTLVRQHIAESRRQLRAVCDLGLEELPQALERMLTRWEQKRAAECADEWILQGRIGFSTECRALPPSPTVWSPGRLGWLERWQHTQKAKAS